MSAADKSDSSLRRWIRSRLKRLDDRGVAIVEMAIVAPFLMFVAAGVMEFGLLWRDNLTATTSTRAAARIVSNLGSDAGADREALIALGAGLRPATNFTIEGVLIYSATASSDGAPPAACFDPSDEPQGAAGLCNYYSSAQLEAALVCATTGVGCDPFDTCTGLNPVADFCPTTRNDDQASAAPLDSVGVWVRIQRDYVTGLLPGDGMTIEDFTVMRVEPAN